MVQILPEVPSFGTQLARGLGAGIGSGVGQASEMALKLMGEDLKTKRKQALLAPFLGQKTSSGTDSPMGEGRDESQKREPIEEQIAAISLIEPNLAKVLESQRKERSRQSFATESERFKSGLPVYKEAGEKLRSFTENKRRLGILEDLEKGKNLPSGLGRLNVDKEGNLRLPFLASADAQRFVKTINEFAAGAKNTYGARVTNFDLQQYMKQFPSLLNSVEGRKQLYEQLKTVNDINSIYYKNLKNAYERAGGARKIDADAAEMIAEKMSEPQIEKLTEKFKHIGTSPTLPSATKNKGERFQNEETGDIFFSDGKSWIKQG